MGLSSKRSPFEILFQETIRTPRADQGPRWHCATSTMNVCTKANACPETLDGLPLSSESPLQRLFHHTLSRQRPVSDGTLPSLEDMPTSKRPKTLSDSHHKSLALA